MPLISSRLVPLNTVKGLTSEVTLGLLSYQYYIKTLHLDHFLGS